MKITRKALLIIIAALAIFIIVYSLFSQFTGIGLDEAAERFMVNTILIAAVGLFIYNRKLARDEKLAKESEEEPPPAEETMNNDDLPHWERK